MTPKSDSVNICHPRHFALTRPYAKDLFRLARDPSFTKKVLAREGCRTGSEFDRTRAIGLSYLKHSDPIVKSGAVPDGPQTNLWMHSGIHDSQIYTMFCESGRMIFDFSDELTTAFNRSELGDARVSDIRLPFDSFYLHFNLTEPILMHYDRPLDGAYIFKGKDEAFIGVMLATANGAAWPDLFDIGINASIEMQPQTLTLSAALEEGFQQKIRQHRELNDEVAAKHGLSRGQYETPMEDYFFSRFEIFKQVFHLIGNALLYLSAYPEEIESAWDNDAPAELVEKASHGRPKERRSAHIELWEKGFSKIHYCRFSHPDRKGSRADQEGMGHKVSQHWRRGHWRNQPHGPQNSLRKLRWLRPCLVGSGPATAKGREYAVGSGR